ncbi:MAG: DNA cytosine methyltransferase [Candidatus Thorarchaeota archaeon]|nr:DNA cytosine methyltransferase [Candidatus Thorarchaeota archaeon]
MAYLDSYNVGLIMYKVLDLFCGAGGFSHGFASTFKGTHLAVDTDPLPLSTYSKNYPDAKVLQSDIGTLHSDDIIEIMGGPPDIIVASPPCEEYSIANPDSRSSATERIYGTGTARLLLDTIRLIGDLSPRAYVVENVAALLQSGGKTIAQREFHRAGVDDMRFNLIRSHRHGNPSKRLRLFMSNVELKLSRKKAPTVMEAIGDLPSLGIDGLFEYNEPVPNHEYPVVSEDRMKKIRKTSWGRGARHFRISKTKALPNWVRLFPDMISTSIIGLSRYIHPFEDRLLTVREHARLMSYPDDFIFLGHIDSQYNQVGESVPPLIAQLIAEEVKSYIE